MGGWKCVLHQGPGPMREMGMMRLHLLRLLLRRRQWVHRWLVVGMESSVLVLLEEVLPRLEESGCQEGKWNCFLAVIL